MPSKSSSSNKASTSDEGESWIESFVGKDGEGVTPMAKQMILGGVSGWVTGFLAMKIGKAAATAIGGGIILLQIANHQGYININWSRLQRDVDKVTTKITEGDKKKDWTDKLERKIEKLGERAEEIGKKFENKSKKWWEKVIGGRESREIQIFITSFAVGSFIGVITGA